MKEEKNYNGEHKKRQKVGSLERLITLTNLWQSKLAGEREKSHEQHFEIKCLLQTLGLKNIQRKKEFY